MGRGIIIADMGEIVNLRRARKAKLRDAAAVDAAAARARHGRTTAQVQAERIERTRAERALDGARLPDPPDA